MDQLRSTLAPVNEGAWNGDTLKLASKLDSSLKKNTAFLRKLKVLNLNDQQTVLKDIELLSLGKYLGEIEVNLAESLPRVLRGDEIVYSVQVVSKLHQRFALELTPKILLFFIRELTTAETDSDSDERKTKVKNLLRLMMELTLVRVFRTVKDCEKSDIPSQFFKRLTKENVDDPVVLTVLKSILQQNIKTGDSLPVAVSFLKRFHSVIYSSNDLLPEQDKFQATFKIYSDFNIKLLQELHSRYNKFIKAFNASNMKYGKLFEDKQEEMQEHKTEFEYFRKHCETLGSLLGFELPDLQVQSVISESTKDYQTIEIIKSENDLSIWDSAEEEAFYTNIPSLEDIKDVDVLAYSSLSDGEKITKFLSEFEQLANNPKSAEALVGTFNALGLNNKATKNRLFKFLTEFDDSSHFKVYTRFLKINFVNMEDLINDLYEYLDNKLRSQIFHERLNFKFIYFYVEFIIFKLVPNYMIFHKIRNLTLDLAVARNMDILTVIYEKCGRFLIYDSDYRHTMLQMIILLKDQKKSENLPLNIKLAIGNLLLILELPTKLQEQEETLYNAKQQFLIRIIKNDLDKETITNVDQILQKFAFTTDPDVQDLISECFVNIKLVNPNNLHLSVKLLKKLARHRKSNKFVLVQVIDKLVESITRGYEVNDYRMNKERTFHFKLLAELYNQELIVSVLPVLNLLNKMFCYGHPNNLPLPMSNPDLDRASDFIKIRLCCTFVNHLDQLLHRRVSSKRGKGFRENETEFEKAKLYSFVVFFQYYLFCKEHPIPREVGFEIDDLFEFVGRSIEIKRFDTFEECLLELKELLAKTPIKEDDIEKSEELDVDSSDDGDTSSDETGDEESSGSEDSDISEDEEDGVEVEESKDEEVEDLEENVDDLEDLDELEDDDDDESDDEEEIRFQEELDKEFQKLIFDTSSARGNKTLWDTLPTTNSKSSGFSLLVKKGKKTELKQIALDDAELEQSIRQRREQKEAQNRRIIDLVMKMDKN